MNNPPWNKPGKVVNKTVRSAGRHPSTAAIAATWKRRFERLLFIRSRTASAIMTPATGARNIVNKPILVTIQLPTKDNTPAMKKADK